MNDSEPYRPGEYNPLLMQRDVDHSTIHQPNNSSSVVQIESSKLLPWLLLSTLLSAASIMGTLFALRESGQAALEARLVQQQIMDQSALLVREGLKQPSDTVNGPAGNIQYDRR